MSKRPVVKKKRRPSIREVMAPRSKAADHAVLLVEDEPLLVALYASVLKKLTEAKVLTATEEQQALELIEREKPEVILLDLMIPTVASHDAHFDFHEPVGFEVLRRVKANPATKGSHVIVLTNLDADEHKQRAHDLGAEDYIVKALLRPQELAQRIAKYLGTS